MINDQKQKIRIMEKVKTAIKKQDVKFSLYSLIWIVICTGYLLFLAGCKDKNEIAPINFNPSVSYGSMTDQDGNTYKTVTIGTQTWMAENLRTTIYRNGDQIPNVTDNTQWMHLTTGAYCWYNNDISYQQVYGALYNWFAVTDNRNIAPAGWHIPSITEWETLINYFGGGVAACVNLREGGTTHWTDYNADNANESGFTGLPAGSREYMEGAFFGINYYGNWWSSVADAGDAKRAWNIGLNYWYTSQFSWNNVGDGTLQKVYGLSVRCIKDN
jgi:uncharacterized protein (TIGR02145 family)